MNEILWLARFVAGAVVAVLPAFLLSVGLAVLIRSLALEGAIRRAFEARVGLGILLATAVGAFSPLCSCTVIPVVSGLLLSGVPLAPVMSFWIASPTMDPEIFALSVATLGWPLALARLGATLAVSLGAGWLTLALTRWGFLTGDLLRLAAPPPAPVLVQIGGLRSPARRTISGGSGCCAGGPAPAAGGGWRSLLVASVARLEWRTVARGFVWESVRLGRWLLLAFVLEAVIVRYVPQAAIAQVLGRESWLAVPLAALVGVPLYLNSASALPIVSGLIAQGMQPGAAIAFLIAGPVTTVPAMAAVWGVARPRVFALYAGAGFGGALLLGALTNLLLA
ncbi:MAG: hypothetical protein A3F92_14475 [Candidatus Rokubacteria bacterium RIFCSPLOWO2_12_FULL_71_22]|nr:MAG: hypothetical protein A3I17_11940 [Candidatus Rokubacteria bacterium RIFCSPLOWO2_02_FULL_72_37]OGL16732.1 MAG: hypothetical protein A3F92_14475 [Candidatus Rokubacteria bacterium RIFCSPLOWO2_12_FULL_71_22]